MEIKMEDKCLRLENLERKLENIDVDKLNKITLDATVAALEPFKLRQNYQKEKTNQHFNLLEEQLRQIVSLLSISPKPANQ